MTFPLSALKKLLETPVATSGVVVAINDSGVTVATSNGSVVVPKQTILAIGDKVSLEDGIAIKLLKPSIVIEV